MADARSEEALARELAEALQAIATPPPGAGTPAPAGRVRSSELNLAGPRAILENGARFVAPVLPADTRFRAAKALILRALRIVTRDQTVFNSALAESVRAGFAEIEAVVPALREEAEHALSRAREELERRGDDSEHRILDALRRAREALETRFESAVAELRAERVAGEATLSAEAGRIASVLTRVAGDLARVKEELHHRVDDEQAARERLERARDAAAEELARRHEREDARAAALERELRELAEGLREARLEWTALRGRLREGAPAASAAGMTAPVGAGGAASAAAAPVDAGDALRAGLYVDFERRFRGSEEEIAGRQRADVELFRGVPGPVADLGCGRGELVGLLAASGIAALGCDANPIMVAAARQKGLEVEEADLFTWLSARPDGSLGGITAYQVVEHLPPSRLFDLVELAVRKLARGGRVLFETINPESVYAMKWFWMDLSHVRPVPAPSLEQLLLASGFRNVVIDYRSPVPEDQALPPGADPALAPIARLLFAPQDYAVTGVK